MKQPVFLSILAIFLAVSSAPVGAADGTPRGLSAVKISDPPKIDGLANDGAWTRAKPLSTLYPLARATLEIRAVYTDTHVYFLAQFPDGNENRNHKTLVWIPEQELYRIGVDREDTFIVKWSMEPVPHDLRVDSDTPYKADIWYWKSHRTDHAGYADDKMHVYSTVKMPKARRVLSKNGTRFYLIRPGDNGEAAYHTVIRSSHVGNRAPLFTFGQPSGSRADVRAKGKWENGKWTVEFARKLNTGHSDDVQFDTRNRYHFGVSRYEIAARKRNPKLQEPWFGAGEITELLSLSFN